MQREFSNEVASLFGETIRQNYPSATEGIDIGSFYRGTNTEGKPDVDIMFLGVPHDPQQGFFDWSDRDTHAMTGSWDGITSLEQVTEIDPRLARTITQSLERLQPIGSHPQFHWVRTWGDFPGVVFNASVENPLYGHLDFDVNLYYPQEYFGVEHAKRFNQYVDNVATRFGEGRAVQLLQDIRRLKQQVKNQATQGGKIDKARKVPGFVVESLFTHGIDPLSYEQVVHALTEHTWSSENVPNLPEKIPNIKDQLIGANRSFNEVLRLSVTRGGYETLKSVARAQLPSPPSQK